MTLPHTRIQSSPSHAASDMEDNHNLDVSQHEQHEQHKEQEEEQQQQHQQDLDESHVLKPPSVPVSKYVHKKIPSGPVSTSPSDEVTSKNINDDITNEYSDADDDDDDDEDRTAAQTPTTVHTPAFSRKREVESVRVDSGNEVSSTATSPRILATDIARSADPTAPVRALGSAGSSSSTTVDSPVPAGVFIAGLARQLSHRTADKRNTTNTRKTSSTAKRVISKFTANNSNNSSRRSTTISRRSTADHHSNLGNSRSDYLIDDDYLNDDDYINNEHGDDSTVLAAAVAATDDNEDESKTREWICQSPSEEAQWRADDDDAISNKNIGNNNNASGIASTAYTNPPSRAENQTSVDSTVVDGQSKANSGFATSRKTPTDALRKSTTTTTTTKTASTESTQSEETMTSLKPLDIITIRLRDGNRNRVQVPFLPTYDGFVKMVRSTFDVDTIYLSYLVRRKDKRPISLSNRHPNPVYECDIVDQATYMAFRNLVTHYELGDAFIILTVGKYEVSTAEQVTVMEQYYLDKEPPAAKAQQQQQHQARVPSLQGAISKYRESHRHQPSIADSGYAATSPSTATANNTIVSTPIQQNARYESSLLREESSSEYGVQSMQSGNRGSSGGSAGKGPQREGSTSQVDSSDNSNQKGYYEDPMDAYLPMRKKRKRVNYVIQYVNSKAGEQGSSSTAEDKSKNVLATFVKSDPAAKNEAGEIVAVRTTNRTKTVFVNGGNAPESMLNIDEADDSKMLEVHSEILRSGSGKDHKMISVLFRQIALQQSVQHAYNALDDHYKIKFLCLRGISERLFGDGRYVMNPLQVLCPLCLSPIKLTTLCDKRMGNLMNKKHHLARNHLRGDETNPIVASAKALLSRWELLMRSNITRLMTVELLDMVEMPPLPDIVRRTILSPDLFVGRWDYVTISKEEERRLMRCVFEAQIAGISVQMASKQSSPPPDSPNSSSQCSSSRPQSADAVRVMDRPMMEPSHQMYEYPPPGMNSAPPMSHVSRYDYRDHYVMYDAYGMPIPRDYESVHYGRPPYPRPPYPYDHRRPPYPMYDIQQPPPQQPHLPLSQQSGPPPPQHQPPM